jgi:biotin carboxyl carrier protein
VHIATYRITAAGKTYEVEILGTGNGATFEVSVDGARHRVQLPQSAQAINEKPETSIAPGAVVAQIPGQVVEVNVKNGDTVTAGDTLIVLNSMKMNIKVDAPTDGVIAELDLAVGDSVSKAQTILQIT